MYAQSISSIRPDKILVVKCKYERSLKKITFSSARNCTFHLLQTRVEQCFSLRASSYTIQYKDDDGEVAEISSENELTEAISYFHAPNEDTHSVRDSVSLRSFQSRSQRKITIYVDVVPDYDGPSLSDTSSVSGSESDDRPSSELSYGLSELARNPFGLREPEFDERTVSSRDRSSVPASLAAPPSLSAPSASRGPTRRLPPIPSALPSIQASGSNAGSSPSRSESPYGADDDSNHAFNADAAADPSAVFARIKLQESLGGPGDLLRPMPLGHLAWVEQQRGLTPAAIMNSRLRSSRSSGALSSSAASSAGSASLAPSGNGKLALEQDLRGKYYYTYTSSEPAASLHAPSSSRSAGGDSLIDALSLYMANNDDPVAVRPGRFSRSTDASAPLTDDKRFSTSTGASGSGLQRFDSVSSSRHTSLIAHMSTNGHEHDHMHIAPDIPPEVLRFVTGGLPAPPPPRDAQTDCSSCGAMLDAFRYVCTTCGEKRPVAAQQQNGSFSGSGTARSLTPQPARLHVQTSVGNPFLTDEEATQQQQQDYSYPPSHHRSPTSSSSTLADPFGQYPKPLPPAPSLLLPTSPGTMGGSPQTPSSMGGYELCVSCMEGAGVVHAMESTTALGVSGAYPSSPLSAASSLPASDDAMSELRRAAPSRKGQIRHAFVEKVWGPAGWTDVEQDDNVDKCSICAASLALRRYKCASCQNFNLCRACYSQVHEIHPSHAFLVVPEKQQHQPPRIQLNDPMSLKSKQPRASMLSMTSTIGEEESLTHPDVKCAHCMQDIVGARFHCAICDNIDICANCESAGLPGNLTSADGGHDYSHIMIKIPYPLNNKEVQTASQRALTLWTRRDSRHISRKARSRSEYSSHTRTVVGAPAPSPAPPLPDGASSHASTRSRPISASTNGSAPMSIASSSVSGHGPLDHRTKCKHCRQHIIGVRYQCATCPSSPHAYSLCAACEPKSYFIHDGNHIFFKLPRPVERPIKSPFPFIPYLYRTPAGLFSDGTTDPANPEAYLLTLRHPTALCDWCMERIRGKWYRCAYCPKDLCADCEAIDTHDSSHLFVVFKSSVDMTQLRNFSDLEHPAPLIPYPVY